MTKKRIRALAGKLRGAFCKGGSLVGAPGYIQASWLAVARLAIQELGDPSKPSKRERAKPKVCRIDNHGKRVCG